MNTVIYSISVLGCLGFFVCGLAVVHEMVSIVRIFRHELQIVDSLSGQFRSSEWRRRRRIAFAKRLTILLFYAIIYFSASFSFLYGVLT